MVLICIFLIISNVEHLFKCLLAICFCPLENCLFRSSAYLPIGLCFFVVGLDELFWKLSPRGSHHLQILLPNLWVLILFTVSFAVQKLVKL